MDLTPGQQRLLFVVVVILLAGLGFFLVSSHNSDNAAPAAQGTPTPSTPSPSTVSNAGTAAGASTAATATPPATVPAATPASTAGGAEIYQWLPFTPADLTAAAQTTLAFTKNYATWSYKENKAAYAATLSGLVTAHELTTLESGYSTAGLSAQRVSAQQVSTGSGTIDSITSFGSGTITFLVTVTQQVASTSPTQTVTAKNAVTVVSAGGSWQVDDIELSTLGNQ